MPSMYLAGFILLRKAFHNLAHLMERWVLSLMSPGPTAYRLRYSCKGVLQTRKFRGSCSAYVVRIGRARALDRWGIAVGDAVFLCCFATFLAGTRFSRELPSCLQLCGHSAALPLPFKISTEILLLDPLHTALRYIAQAFCKRANSESVALRT